MRSDGEMTGRIENKISIDVAKIAFLHTKGQKLLSVIHILLVEAVLQ